MACSQCDIELQQNDFTTCKNCNKKVHWECLDVPPSVISTVKEIADYISWFCHECQNSPKAKASPQGGEPSLVRPSWNYPTSTKHESSFTDEWKVQSQSSNPSQEVFFPKEESSEDDATRNGNTVHSGKSSKDPKVQESYEDIRRSQVEKLKRRYERMDAWVQTISGDFSLKDYFVDLEFELLQPGERISEKIRLNEIVGSKEGYRKILITGDAGYGKTTLTKKLCYDWSTLHSRDNYMSRFDIVLNLPVGIYNFFSIESVIQNELLLHKVENTKIGNVLKGQRILFILDGLDEFIAPRQADIFLANLLSASKKIIEDLTILVTSRPLAVRDYCHGFDRHLSIIGFSAPSQKQYMKNVLRVETAVKSLLDPVENYIFAKKASQCPLLLHLICCVHETGNTAAICSRVELYSEMFKLLTQFYDKNNGKGNISKSFPKTLDKDEFFIRVGEFAFRYTYGEFAFRYTYGEFAFRYTYGEFPFRYMGEFDFLCDMRKYRSILSLKEIHYKKELEFLLGSGILTIPKVGVYGALDKYKFVHITFAEFLSSIYIANRLRAHYSTIIDGIDFLDCLGNTALIFILSWLDKNTQVLEQILLTLKNKRSIPELTEICKEACQSYESRKIVSSVLPTMSWDF